MNLFADQAPTIGHGMTTRREPVVPPEDFAKLQSSTSKYKYLSEAYVFRVGSTFEETGLPFIRTAFQQTRIQETKEPSGPVPPVLNQNQKGK
jgi:hypothetical protein